ncbi:MAG: hypothetical protein ACREM1_11425 [Longimicrobiales bacterium]
MAGNKRGKEAGNVRDTDVEPYTALRWVGTLFKAAAVFLLVALIGELVAGLRVEGARVLPMLLGDTARMAVLAVVLWGAGDLVRLLIQLGNDVRAERILLSRLVDRTPAAAGDPSAEGAHSESIDILRKGRHTA